MYYYIYQLYMEINDTHHIFHTNYLEDVSNVDDIRDEIISKIEYNTPLNKFLKEIIEFEIKIIDKVPTTERIRPKLKYYRDESGQHFASYNVNKIKQYQKKNKQKYSDYTKKYWKDPDNKPHLRKFNEKYRPTIEWEYSLGYWDK